MSEQLTLADIEKKTIERRLSKENNKSKVAASLGITLKTLYNKLNDYGLYDKFCHRKGSTTSKENSK